MKTKLKIIACAKAALAVLVILQAQMGGAEATCISTKKSPQPGTCTSRMADPNPAIDPITKKAVSLDVRYCDATYSTTNSLVSTTHHCQLDSTKGCIPVCIRK